jgi:hypothetical protein
VKSRANTPEVKALRTGSRQPMVRPSGASDFVQPLPRSSPCSCHKRGSWRHERTGAASAPLCWRTPVRGALPPFVGRVLPVVGRDYELRDRPVDPTDFAGGAARRAVSEVGITEWHCDRLGGGNPRSVMKTRVCCTSRSVMRRLPGVDAGIPPLRTAWSAPATPRNTPRVSPRHPHSSQREI